MSHKHLVILSSSDALILLWARPLHRYCIVKKSFHLTLSLSHNNLFNLLEILQSIIFSFTIYIFHCEMFFNFAIFHPLCWAGSGGAAICMIERYSVHQQQHIQYWCYIWYLIFSFWMILFISFLYFSQNAFDIVLKRSSH